MYKAAKVQFPSLGYYPGFASLAQEPANEWRGSITPLRSGNILNLASDPNAQFVGNGGGLGSIDFSSFSSAVNSSFDIGGYSIPLALAVPGVLAVALLIFGRGGPASKGVRRARRIARLRGELAAQSV